jgi:DNA mismatch repair protein MutL
VGFRLKVEGDETMNLPTASGLKERLVQIYGAEFVDGLCKVDVETGGISIEGFVSKPDNFRNSRSHQFIFINKRAVREPSLAHAALNAYQGYGQGGRFPALFLYYTLDPGGLDVNVHPQKEEVRFADKGAMYRFTLHAVRRAAGLGGGGAFEAHAEAGTHMESSQEGPAGHEQGGGGYGAGAFDAVEPVVTAGQVSEPLAMDYGTETAFVYLGESFVACPGPGGGVMLIDTHAAHERVLYERLLRGVELNPLSLLFPRQVELSPAEHRVIVQNSALLTQMGIEVDDFGGGTVIVRTLPEALEEADIRGILADVAHEITDGSVPGRGIREAVAARVACHGSVRGDARRLGNAELSALLQQLGHAQDPDHCPHGRPTRVTLGVDELKKMFKRT